MSSPLRLLSAGSIRRGVSAVIGLFEGEADATVEADFTSAPRVAARLRAGEHADVVVASAAVIAALAAEGRLQAGAHAIVGCTPMAVAVRRGVRLPGLADAAAFREALLGADLVAYNQGTSGLHAAAVIDRLELREALGARIRVVRNGAEMFELIATGPGRVLGLANVTNIRDQLVRGAQVELASLLPAELQQVTTYRAAAAAGARDAGLAARFVAAFETAQGRRVLADAGVEPAH